MMMLTYFFLDTSLVFLLLSTAVKYGMARLIKVSLNRCVAQQVFNFSLASKKGVIQIGCR